jgi:hypothetical protein
MWIFYAIKLPCLGSRYKNGPLFDSGTFMYIYLCIHLFTHINVRNNLSCIYSFVSGIFIYVYVFYVVTTVSFTYYLFILSCLFMYLRRCDLCNDVSFIYLFITPCLFIYAYVIYSTIQPILFIYLYVIYVTMTVSCIYLLFHYNARLINFFIYVCVIYQQ